MVFKKIIFQNKYVALETPPLFMANAILNFHFDFLNPSLIAAAVIDQNIVDLLKQICLNYVYTPLLN